MASKSPRRRSRPWALKAVVNSLALSNNQMGAARTFLTLARINQKDGFDCPGCAWPDPDAPEPRRVLRERRKGCRRGGDPPTGDSRVLRRALALRAAREERALARPARSDDHADARAAGSDHYDRSTGTGRTRSSPTSCRSYLARTCGFYTSGRTSNEAAFVYQLMVRRFGTNNLPDCSNMCHESSGSALAHTIGIGKGSVLLDDIYEADLILVVGQNPGTNHPRMLSALERAKRNGAHIVTVNPLARGRARRVPQPAVAQEHVPRAPSSRTTTCRSGWQATRHCSPQSGSSPRGGARTGVHR